MYSCLFYLFLFDYLHIKLDKLFQKRLKEFTDFKSALKYPECFYKRSNWIKWCKYLESPQSEAWVKQWFGTDNHCTFGGFPNHFNGNINKLLKIPLKIRGTTREKVYILEDLLRRLRNGSLIKVKKEDLDYIVPIFMISKLRDYTDQSKGYKNRLIFNHSINIKSGKGINHGIQDHNRRVKYPDIIPSIIDLTEKTYNKYQRVYVAQLDIEHGFENMFVNQHEMRQQGIHAFGIYMASAVSTYGEASRPKQMHHLSNILIDLIEIYAKYKLKQELKLKEWMLIYMDDFCIWGGSAASVNYKLRKIIKISKNVFGIRFKPMFIIDMIGVFL